MSIRRSKWYTKSLWLGWSIVGISAVVYAQNMEDELVGKIQFVISIGVWLGALLSISMMEAWVKFQAPLLRRHIGFDVGRHVFAGLNSMESAFSVNLALSSLAFEYCAYRRVITCLCMILALQVLFIAPALELRALHIIDAEIGEKEKLTEKEQKHMKLIRRNVKASKSPPKAFHMVYVLAEVVKIVLLVGLNIRVLVDFIGAQAPGKA